MLALAPPFLRLEKMMRREDFDQFNISYDGLDSSGRELRSREALGVRTPAAHAVFEEIAADLSNTLFGIGWWAPHPDKHRRILIADQLVLCAQSVEANVVEARLHLLELREARDKAAALMRGRVTATSAGARLQAAERAGDELPAAMATLHMGGLLRAIGSALDCLAGVTIGVAAIPLSILRADFSRVLNFLRVLVPADEGTRAQGEIGKSILVAIERVGPPGWLAWALDYRNMLVHRGRQMTMTHLLPEKSPILSATGLPTVYSRPVVLLPNDPGRSEVEVLLDAPANHFMLTEDATLTVEGVYESTVQLVEAASLVLLDLWRRRRNSPSLLVQPKKQWERIPATQPCGFAGYAPGTIEMAREGMHVHSLFYRRLLAAALTDPQRGEWERP